MQKVNHYQVVTEAVFEYTLQNFIDRYSQDKIPEEVLKYFNLQSTMKNNNLHWKLHIKDSSNTDKAYEVLERLDWPTGVRLGKNTSNSNYVEWKKPQFQNSYRFNYHRDVGPSRVQMKRGDKFRPDSIRRRWYQNNHLLTTKEQITKQKLKCLKLGS